MPDTVPHAQGEGVTEYLCRDVQERLEETLVGNRVKATMKQLVTK